MKTDTNEKARPEANAGDKISDFRSCGLADKGMERVRINKPSQRKYPPTKFCKKKKKDINIIISLAFCTIVTALFRVLQNHFPTSPTTQYESGKTMCEFTKRDHTEIQRLRIAEEKQGQEQQGYYLVIVRK